MRIYTSGWFVSLPPEIQKIGISRGTPRGYPAGYRKMMALAPGQWFKTATVTQYRQLFFENLRRLDPQRVVAEIEAMTDGRDAALLCYESPEKDEDWCHRGYVSAWLHDRLGLEVFEYGLEDRGAGWRHPKIPAQFRQRPAPQALDVSRYVGATADDRTGRTWKVIGIDPENPDQAMVEAIDGARRPISAEILHEKFQPSS